LSAAGIKATFYIIGDSIGSTPTYTTASQIKQLAADGHEIGNHTWSHADLANLSSAAIATEFDKAQQAIVSKVGVTPTVCAYPYGSYNNTVVSVAGARFGNCRTTDGGLNTTSTLARTGAYRIMDFNVDSNTSVAMVKKAIDDAIAAKAWLVVVYHEVGASIGGGVWHTKTADLQAEMTYLRQQVAAGKAANVTMAQGYAATK
jgi:peptidoglycan/xylan/chitin deacetylase (PgdA/CDA1 family)